MPSKDVTRIAHSFSGKVSCFIKISKKKSVSEVNNHFFYHSANKGSIIDACKQLMLSITRATKKEKTMDGT